MAKKLTFAQLEQNARQKLAKAVQRGRRDEIQGAKLALANVVRGQKQQERAEQQKQAEKQEQKRQLEERRKAPKTEAERRSAASAKGWQTRKKIAAFSGRIFVVDDLGELFPKSRSDLTTGEKLNQDIILRDFAVGSSVWGTYEVAPDAASAQFWCGVVVYQDASGETAYRYIPRALTEQEAVANIEALSLDYKAKNQVCAVVPLL